MGLPSAWLIVASAWASLLVVTGERLRQRQSSNATALQPRDDGSTQNARLLCRLQPPASGGGDRILEVWEQPGNVRMAEFQNMNSFESRVHCKGDMPACQAVDPNVATDISACLSCPCDLDSSRDTSESERAIVDAVMPRCGIARGGSVAPADVLLLGLGGGVVHTTLRNSCPDGLRLRSAEIDPRFAAIASQFFGLPLASGASEVVVGDALAVVKQELQARAASGAVLVQGAGKAYGLQDAFGQQSADGLGDAGAASALGISGWDVVVIDCFIGKGRTPESCRSGELVQDVKKLLKPNGLVVHHMWHESPQDEHVAPEFQATLGEYRNSFGSDAVKVFPIFRENPDLRLDDLILARA